MIFFIPKGEPGEQGFRGEKGDQGPKGNDGTSATLGHCLRTISSVVGPWGRDILALIYGFGMALNLQMLVKFKDLKVKKGILDLGLKGDTGEGDTGEKGEKEILLKA